MADSCGAVNVAANNSAPVQLKQWLQNMPLRNGLHALLSSVSYECVYVITFTGQPTKPSSVLGEFKHNDVLISLATTVILEKLK